MFLEDISNKKQLNELYLKLMKVAKTTDTKLTIKCPPHTSRVAVQNVAKYFMCFISEIRIRELHKTKSERLWDETCEEIYDTMVDPFIKEAWLKGMGGKKKENIFH